jgi:FkbH-like protein
VTRFAAEAHATADRSDFLRESRIELEIARADVGSCERMSELIIRSHRLNSTGEVWTPDQLRAIVDDPRWLVTAATLTDRYGDYGLIATMLIDRGDPSSWRLRSLTTSCRAAGRAVPTALLAWAQARARAEAVGVLLVDVVARPENLQLRVLLRSAGFGATARAAAGAAAGAVAVRAENALVLSRATTPPIDVPDWLHVRTPDRAGA